MLIPLAAAAIIGPIELQDQRALPIGSLAFSPVDGRPHPISVSMDFLASPSGALNWFT